MDDLEKIVRAMRNCAEMECSKCQFDEGACVNGFLSAAADRLEAMAKELHDADSDRHLLFLDLCGANARADEYEADRDDWKARAEAAEEWSQKIASMPCCNDCADQKTCEKKPVWGEICAINCPLWRGPCAENSLASTRTDENGGKADAR